MAATYAAPPRHTSPRRIPRTGAVRQSRRCGDDEQHLVLGGSVPAASVPSGAAANESGRLVAGVRRAGPLVGLAGALETPLGHRGANPRMGSTPPPAAFSVYLVLRSLRGQLDSRRRLVVWKGNRGAQRQTGLWRLANPYLVERRSVAPADWLGLRRYLVGNAHRPRKIGG